MHTLIARLKLISNGRHTLPRARLKYILIGDVMTETRDLRVFVLHAGTSHLCLSHVVGAVARVVSHPKNSYFRM
jgi:hypothetical protein